MEPDSQRWSFEAPAAELADGRSNVMAVSRDSEPIDSRQSTLDARLPADPIADRGVVGVASVTIAALLFGVVAVLVKFATVPLALGVKVMKCPSLSNVLKDTYDHSCYRARADEYQHLMTLTFTPRRRR